MAYLAGKIVLDVDAGAPNNGRADESSVGNITRVKQMRIGREIYPYVSAQALRRWWRDSLPAQEKRSPVIRSGTGKKQQAYTKGRPDLYLDDDLFGYMVALKGASTQRDTVLATGTAIAVAPRFPVEDFGTMSRGFAVGDNPVLHEHEFYSAELAADVLLDLPRIGVFEVDGSGLKVALTGESIAEAKTAGAEEHTLRGISALRLPLAERRRRAAVVLQALASLQGGAKQALHYGDRAPAFVLLAPLKGGINPFTRIFQAVGAKTVFEPGVLREEIGAWDDELDGPVRIGWAPGFLGEQREQAKRELKDLIDAGTLLIEHPRVVLGGLAEEITAGGRDAWFEDPAR